MRNKIAKTITILMISAAMIIATVAGSWAVSYYTAGDSYSGTALRLYTSGGTKYLKFYTDNDVVAPSGDALVGASQFISGIYTLTATGDSNIYTLSGATSSLTLTDGGSTNYLSAATTALQINFATNQISWSSVTGLSVTPQGSSLGSDALAGLGSSATWAFSSFTFEENSAESTWLSSGGTLNLRYSSTLEGMAAAPEPAEWALMLMGLALMGYYLHRKGLLNLQFSPQTYA